MTKWQDRQTVMGNKIGALLGRSTEYLDGGKLCITARFNKPVHTWVRDGVDHINVSVHGKTEAGFRLSFASKNIVRHPLLGGFASLQNMLMWSIVRYHPDADSIRWVSGTQRIPVYNRLVNECNEIGCLQAAPINKVAIAAAHIMEVLRSDKELMKEFKRIDIPYDSYLVSPSGLRYRDDYTAPSWYLNTLDVIQKHIAIDRKQGFPNLELFVKSGTAESIYDEILPAYQLDAVLQQRELIKREKEAEPPKKKHHKQNKPMYDLDEEDKDRVSSVLSNLDVRAAAIEVGTTAEDPAPLSNEEAKAFAEVFNDGQPDLQEPEAQSEAQTHEQQPELDTRSYFDFYNHKADSSLEPEAQQTQPVEQTEQQQPPQ